MYRFNWSEFLELRRYQLLVDLPERRKSDEVIQEKRVLLEIDVYLAIDELKRKKCQSNHLILLLKIWIGTHVIRLQAYLPQEM